MLVLLKPVRLAAPWPEKGHPPNVAHPVLTATCSLPAGQAASRWRDRLRRSFSAPRGKPVPGPQRIPSHVQSCGDPEQREPIMERTYPAGEPQQAVSALLLHLRHMGETGCHSPS